MIDFEMAKDKVLMGAERRWMVISEEEKKTTACHEAGHALVAKLLEKNPDPVHKVTIIPRGPALGLTQQLPKEDRLSMSRDFAKARLAVMMGGRVAEEIVFGQFTTGAGNDIKQASNLARAHGHRVRHERRDRPDLVRRRRGERVPRRATSRAAPRLLGDDREPDRRRGAAVHPRRPRRGARQLLTENREILESLAMALLERETLDAEEVDAHRRGPRAAADAERVVDPELR